MRIEPTSVELSFWSDSNNLDYTATHAAYDMIENKNCKVFIQTQYRMIANPSESHALTTTLVCYLGEFPVIVFLHSPF